MFFKPIPFSSSLFLIFTVLFFSLISGCTSKHEFIITPVSKPLLYDDGDTASLLQALDRQYNYLSRLPDDIVFQLGDKSFSSAWLAESIRTFRGIVERKPSPLEMNRILHEKFLVYQAGGRRNRLPGEMLVTGYFEPLLEGSLQKTKLYRFPLYSPPEDLVARRTSANKNIIGRIDAGGVLQPYWTREEIDESEILQGHEIVYLKSRFDAFLLHIQGSGKIQFPDGSIRSIQYRGNNGHPYSSIGKLLVDDGIMQLEEVNMPAIRDYLSRHPDEEKRILYHNKRYIFFALSDGAKEDSSTAGPVGSIGVTLTAGRSIALDGTALPMGVVAYLLSQKPVADNEGTIVKWIPLQRFVLPQDSGAAIKGAGRADLYWGRGRYAEISAGAMKERGKLYLLIKKEPESNNEQ